MTDRKFVGTGRRKASIARVQMVPGKGKITVNGRDVREFFPYETNIMDLMQPLVATNNENTFDISALDYEDGKDILEVYQDGIHLVEDANYRNNHNGTISLIGYQVDDDVEFTFLIHSIRKINIHKPANTLSTTPSGNPGGSGVVYGEDDESVDNITIGNWKVYTDANGSNNLLFLYNDVLKFTMTPTGNMVASDYTERD